LTLPNDFILKFYISHQLSYLLVLQENFDISTQQVCRKVEEIRDFKEVEERI